MRGQHAVVTGVSSGIGQAIAQHLLGLGWRVTGLSRRPMFTQDANFHWQAADLEDLDSLATALDGIGEVDAVVHAAGLQHSGPLGELDPAAGAQMWRVHVQAASFLVDRLLDRLSDGGRIVLIGSRTATGVAGKSQYAATKAALTGMARSWAMELAPRQITVNVLSPGPTDTPMLLDPARAKTPPKLPPLGRFVDPAEIAAMAAFLLGENGRSITGQQIVICAGASL